MSLLHTFECEPKGRASSPRARLEPSKPARRAGRLFFAALLSTLTSIVAGCSAGASANPPSAGLPAARSTTESLSDAPSSPAPHEERASPVSALDPKDRSPFFAPPPGARLPGGSRSHHRASVAGSHMILSGGLDRRLRSLPDLLCFNLERGAFERLPVLLHEPRHRHSATVLPGLDGELGTNDDSILIAGGQGEDGALSSLELVTVDPDGDGDCRDARVEVLGRLPIRLTDHAASLTRLPLSPDEGGRVLIVGGLAEAPERNDYQNDYRREASPTNASFLIDLRQDPSGRNRARIESCPQSPRFARIEHSLTWLLGPDQRPGGEDDRLVVIGGRGLDLRAEPSVYASAPSLATISLIELFDPVHETWSSCAVEPTEDESRSGAELSVLVARTRQRVLSSASSLIVVGGLDDVGAVVLEALEIQFNSLGEASARVAGQLQRGRQDPEVLALGSGRWLITGGYGHDSRHGGYGPLKTAELFDPQGSPCFTELKNPMFSARLYHSIAESGGRVVLSGGYSGASRNDLEMANPDVEVFSEAGSTP